MGRKKKYLTEEERRAAHRERQRRYRERHLEKCRENSRNYNKNHKDKIKQHRQDNKDKMLEYQKQYRHTPIGRAHSIISSYKREDKKHNRGECTITAKWIVENIFTQPCHYCGEEGWEIMGCDRIDNDKPHTPDNVVPCCRECNDKRNIKSYEEFKKEMGMT